jgi:hypothetical protein
LDGDFFSIRAADGRGAGRRISIRQSSNFARPCLGHWRKAQLFEQIVDVLYHLVDVHKELFIFDKFILIIRREKLEQMLPSITVDASQ